jgi:hypothetical protein
VVTAGVPQKWLAISEAQRDHLADRDRVVPARGQLPKVARHPRERGLDERDAVLDPVGDAIELLAFRKLRREHAGQLPLSRREDVHAEPARVADDRQRTRLVLKAHECQQRLQRKRAEALAVIPPVADGRAPVITATPVAKRRNTSRNSSGSRSKLVAAL